MTKEEAIETIKDICLTTEQLTRVEKAFRCLLSKPSLPSNLDEAAQKVGDYYDFGEEHGYLYCHRGDIKDAFKAGAEWMTRQFQEIEEQEQTEADLEKEFEDYLNNIEGQPRMWRPDEQIEWAKDIARHFAEWGAIHFNARKEE